MRKRTIVSVTGLALLSVLILLGCPQPSDSDPAPEKTLLIGEEGLIAKVEPGVNYLWWNAPEGRTSTSLTVYRRDTVNETLKDLTSAVQTKGGWQTVVDAVGWNNQLIDGRVYEYTLYDSGNEILDTVTLKAKVPARDSFAIPLAAADIEVKRYKASNNGDDMLLVTFPNQANLTYEVKYTYGKNQTITKDFGSFQVNSTELADYWFAPARAAAFPLLGGANTIAVKATFIANSGASSANGNYYDQTPVVSKALESYTVAPVLAEPSNITITEAANLNRLTWDHSEPSITEFALFKAEVNKSNISLGSPSNISVTGDWIAVTLKGLGSTVSGGTASWSAYEDVTDHTKYYVYALFAKKGDNQSTPEYAQVSTTVTVPSVTLTADVLSETTTPLNRVRLTWDAAPNTKYRLEFAEARSKSSPGTVEAAYPSDYELVGSYAPVNGNALVPEASYPQGEAVVFHTPAVQKNYIYRLTPEMNGVPGTPSYQMVNSKLYTTVVGLTPYQNTAAADVAKSIQVGLNSSGTYLADGRSYAITLYRREVSDPQTVFASVTTATITETNQFTWTYYDTSVDMQKEYEYKVVAAGYGTSAGSGTVSNLRPVGYNGITVLTSLTYYSTDYTIGSVTIPANSVQISGSNLEGLSVPVLIKRGATTVVNANRTITKLTNTTGGTSYIYYIPVVTTLTATTTYSIRVTGPDGTSATDNFTTP
ncbi:MAG: hypothetical protein LBD37_09675 [Treponema sp.]|nr:hypothetical protein [Treponema sp.]